MNISCSDTIYKIVLIDIYTYIFVWRRNTGFDTKGRLECRKQKYTWEFIAQQIIKNSFEFILN